MAKKFSSRFDMRLTPELETAMAAESAKTGETVAEIARIAIAKYLKVSYPAKTKK